LGIPKAFSPKQPAAAPVLVNLPLDLDLPTIDIIQSVINGPDALISTVKEHYASMTDSPTKGNNNFPSEGYFSEVNELPIPTAIKAALATKDDKYHTMNDPHPNGIPFLPLTLSGPTNKMPEKFIAMYDSGASESLISVNCFNILQMKEQLAFVPQDNRPVRSAFQDKASICIGTVRLTILLTDDEDLQRCH
jgi:hypothetical protein